MSIKLSKDPLIVLFGATLMRKGFRQVERDLLNLNKEINTILQSYISKNR